jgi:SAM-dependent methyltransferase
VLVSQLEAQAYWQDPPIENQPDTYLVNREERSALVADLVAQHVSLDDRVLELGCNAGPNLATLHARGFTALEGVEINPKAVKLLRVTYPQLADTQVHNMPIEEFAAEMGYYDFVFTLAVFEHLHTDSDWVFATVAQHCKWLLTVEDELGVSPRHFPRFYGRLFTEIGMVETWHMKSLSRVGLDDSFVARVFTWKPV